MAQMDLNLHVTERTFPQTVVRTQSSSTLRAMQSDKLIVKACGETMQMDPSSARSLGDLQQALQMELQMEAQSFTFFDVNGTSLTSDAQFHDALANGLTPICATLRDTSIHYIENRREELAQLQWKLVRDQMTVVHGKMSSIGRQATDTQSQLDHFKQDVSAVVERVQKETLWPIEALEKQLEALRDTLDSERSSRRQEMAMQMSVIQDIRAAIDGEKTVREQMKDKHAFDITNIIEKGEAFQKQMTDMLRDQHMAVAKTVEGLHNHFLANVRQVNQMRTDMDSTSQELKMRCVQTEEGCAELENRLMEVSNRQAASAERLAERHERVAQVVETLRLDDKQTKSTIAAILGRIKELEASLQETERMSRELVTQEREGLDDQLRRAQRITHADYKRQITELEEKIADRFERESCERENNVRAIYEEVGKGPLVRSQSLPMSKITAMKTQAAPNGLAIENAIVEIPPQSTAMQKRSVSRQASPQMSPLMSPRQSFVPVPNAHQVIPQLLPAGAPQVLPPGSPQHSFQGLPPGVSPPAGAVQMTPRKQSVPTTISPPSSQRATLVQVAQPLGVPPRGMTPRGQVPVSPRNSSTTRHI